MVINEYSLTQKDLRDSMHLNFKPRPIFAVLGIAFCILVIFILASEFLSNQPIDRRAYILFLVLFFPVFYYIWIFWWAKHCFKVDPFLSTNNCKLIIDDEYVRVVSELADIKIPWHFFKAYKSNTKMIILYIKGAYTNYLCLPKYVFTDSQWEQLNTICADKVCQAKR